MVDEMMTATHGEITHDLGVTGVTALGEQGFDMRGAAAGTDDERAGFERAGARPADEQGTRQQNAEQRQTERQQKGTAPDQQRRKEIKQQAHGHQAQAEAEPQAMQQGAYAALGFEIVEAAGGHQTQHYQGEGQRLGQQGIDKIRQGGAVHEPRAHPQIHGPAQDQCFEHDQQQQV